MKKQIPEILDRIADTVLGSPILPRSPKPPLEARKKDRMSETKPLTMTAEREAEIRLSCKMPDATTNERDLLAELDAERKAHEQTREQLAMQRILKDIACKAFDEVGTICDELRSQNAALRERNAELAKCIDVLEEYGYCVEQQRDRALSELAEARKALIGLKRTLEIAPKELGD